jgi:hypothetical protein
MSSTGTLSAMPQFNVQQPPTSVSVDQTPNNSASIVSQPPNNSVQTNQTITPSPDDSVVISNKAADKAKQIFNVSANKQKYQPTAMSHMIEYYNNKGKLRIKFVDSKNNMIYQIPSEMVAKTEDLMNKSRTSANLTA